MLLATQRRGGKKTSQERCSDRRRSGLGRPHASRNGNGDEVLGERKMSQKITSYPGKEITADQLKQGEYLDTVANFEPRYSWAAGVAISRFLEEMKKGRLIGRKCLNCKRTLVPP